MFSTVEFSKAMKFTFIATVILSVLGLIIHLFGLGGFSISRPQDNTTLRVILNNGFWVINTLVFWVAVGIASKDKLASAIAGFVAISIYLGYELQSPTMVTKDLEINLGFLLKVFSYSLPLLLFGIIHWKGIKGVWMFIVWLIFWGQGLGHISFPFEQFVAEITSIVGIENPLGIKIKSGNSTRTVSVFSMVYSQLIIVSNVIIVYWFFKHLQKGKNVFKSLFIINAESMTRLSYSMMYWALRLVLFVQAWGAIEMLQIQIRNDFSAYYFFQTLCYCFGLFITATIYRNFLVSRFVSKGEYPEGLFFFLNIPIINFFAWLYSLYYFSETDAEQEEEDIEETVEEITIQDLKQQFIDQGRNPLWRYLILAIFLFIALFQLNKAGLRVDAPSTDRSLILLAQSSLAFLLLFWYLKSKSAFWPLLIISALGMIIPILLNQPAILSISIASSLVNTVVFFGLFHFNYLSLEGEDQAENFAPV